MNPLEQSMSALDAANLVRMDRAKLKKQIAAGEVPAWRVLEESPDCMRGVMAISFVEFLPNTGSRRAFQILRKADVPAHKRLEHLTVGQTQRLIDVLRAKHPAERGLS